MGDKENQNSDSVISSLIHDESLLEIANTEHEECCSCSTEEVHEIDSETEKKHNSFLDSFFLELQNHAQIDSKIKYALDFMENSLSQEGSPHFKSFWDIRTVCLQLFKENISPSLRAQYWQKYSELSKEARRLKDVLDEQSSFAAEQIEMAIAALESDVTNFDEHVNRLAELELPDIPKVLSKKSTFYKNIQKKLNLLNAQASRINALRKELIKTEMRVRHKNKFFQRLSQIGDKVFPLRKNLIKEISDAFIENVETFIKHSFTDNLHDSLFALREEIKALQGIAKILTLNTYAFTQTRMQLSECWDKIKVAEKERKKERAQLKTVFKENFDAVQLKIQEFKQKFEASELSDDQALKQLDEISQFMRNIELGREEIKILRDQLSAARAPILDKAKAEEQLRHQQVQDREKQRKAKIEELKNEIQQLQKRIPSLNAEELAAVRDEMQEKIQNPVFNKYEKQELERLIKPVRSAIVDALSDKEEETLLSLSADDRQAIVQLKEVLQQRKDRRQEIKGQLELLRKASGTSGLDFEKAMNHNELINSEKERLEKINQGIKEIEDKIAQLQTKR